MGTLLTTSTMIKLLLGSALLALSAAEADPQLLYGAGLPYAAAAPLPYVGATVGAVAHVPVVKSDVVTPAEVEHEVTAHPVAVAVGYHGYPHVGYYGKRSADAEPEADAYYGYYGYGYRGYRGYYGSPYGYRYGYYGKRSADAEPAVLAGASRVVSAPTPLIHNPPVLPAVTYAAHPLAYAGYAAHPLGYAGLTYPGLPVLAPAAAAAEEAVVAERRKREADPQVLAYGLGLGLPYAAAPAVLAPVGAVAHAPVVKSVVDTPAEVAHEVTAHAVPVAVGYHGLGYYGKRSADADPAILAGSTRVFTAPTPLIHNPPVRPVLAAPA